MNYFPIGTYCFNQEDKNEWNCFRYSLSFVFSILIIMIASIWSYKTYKDVGKITYELIPMNLCILQGIIHALQFSIINENHMILIGNLLQIVIFSLVGYSFSLVYQRISFNEQLLKIRKKQILTPIQIIYLAIILLQILCICLTKPLDCNPYEQKLIRFFFTFIILTLVIVISTTIYIVFYGSKLNKYLQQINNRFSNRQRIKESGSVQECESLESDLPKEKIYQVKVVVYYTTINTLLYIFIMIALYFIDDDLLCDFDQKKYLNTTKNILLLIFTFTQLSPCFIVPYAFHYRVKDVADESECLDFQRERTLSSRYKIDDNDEFVNRLTRGRSKISQ